MCVRVPYEYQSTCLYLSERSFTASRAKLMGPKKFLRPATSKATRCWRLEATCCTCGLLSPIPAVPGASYLLYLLYMWPPISYICCTCCLLSPIPAVPVASYLLYLLPLWPPTSYVCCTCGLLPPISAVPVASYLLYLLHLPHLCLAECVGLTNYLEEEEEVGRREGEGG
jgi:hypothetical protein